MKKDNVYESSAVDVPISPVVTMTGLELAKTMMWGAVVGVVSVAAMMLMNTYIFGSVLCRPQSISDCAQAPTYAMIVAMIIGAIMALVVLARTRLYRPLLIVIAATIALWGVGTWLMPLAWYWQLIAAAVLFALGYSLFAWIARIRNFVLALVVTVVVIVTIRLLLTA